MSPTSMALLGPATGPRRVAILVLGMHRSGTSALTRVVNRLGGDLPSNLMPPDDDNEAGFWESIDIYRLNDEILESAGSSWDDWRRFNSDWFASPTPLAFKSRALRILEQDFDRSSLFVLKDPRICRLLPFWLDVLETFQTETKCIIPIRNPLEVAASLKKRNGFSPSLSSILWLRHALDAEHDSRGLARAFLSYDDLLDDWRGVMTSLGDRIGLAWPRYSATSAIEIDEFLEARHRHHALDAEKVARHPALAPWVKETYAALRILESDPISIEPLPRLDRTRKEFDRASDALGAILRLDEKTLRQTADNLADKIDVLAARETRIGELEHALADQQTQSTARETRIGELEHALADQQTQSTARATRIGELEHALADQQTQSTARATRIGELEHALADQQTQSTARETRIGELEHALADQQTQSTARETRIGELKHAIAKLDARLDTAQKTLQEQKITRNRALHRLDLIQTTAAWQFTRPFLAIERRSPRLIRGFLAPLKLIRWTLSLGLSQRLRIRREATQLLISGLFDRDWYVEQNADIVLHGNNCVLHWMVAGWKEQRDPNPLFDMHWYLSRYPEIESSGMNPLFHYIEQGATTGFDPNPLFDSAWYLARYPDVAAVGLNPLSHYLNHGTTAGHNPNPLFDTDWYFTRYPDVAAAGLNPLAHYLAHGATSGRNPNPLFDSAWYLTRYPDVAAAGLNPLAHYLAHGATAGRNPNPLFDSAWYLTRYPDVAAAGLNPLAHYLAYGATAGRNPNPLFDSAWYLTRYPDVAAAGFNPLAHYLAHGATAGCNPNPLFDSAWYLTRYPDVAAVGLNPLAHYLAHGAPSGRNPNPLFDTTWYLTQYPDVAMTGQNPLAHYILYGAQEGRDPSPRFDSGWYLSHNPDVARKGINPLAHYMLHGIKEGRSPKASFVHTNSPSYREPVTIIPFNYQENQDLSGLRLAVCLHAFHLELLPELLDALDNIDIPFNLFLTTDTEQKASAIHLTLAQTPCQQHAEVRVYPNRGRDIAPKLIGLSDIYEHHDLVLHLHTKKSTHNEALANWRRLILTSLLGSTAAVQSILSAFVRLPKLGMIAPRTHPFVRRYMTWESNFELARDMAQRMGVDLAIDSPLDFPAGSMFWARTAALQPLLHMGLSFDDFPVEQGQTDSTLAHVIERLYFYACEKAGYRWVRVGLEGNLRPPESPSRIDSVFGLGRIVSDQMPALLLPGIRPRPADIDAMTADYGLERIKQDFRSQCRKDIEIFLARDERLWFPTFSAPKVSILLVLFNQGELTFHCLKNLQHALDVPCEIIILDNRSTDFTGELLDRLQGPRVIRGKENLHFLKGVNAAAAHARGSYILLLNNDTRLKPGSISAACRRLDAESDLGAVGGKLVLLDGRLQEAGSIIWRDGSCLGYGRGRDPGEAEFQFERDVDYCSAAFLMIRRELFERLGRLDTRFAPAYYEETDLCMRVREMGYRVAYDPRIVVTHFEFGSSKSSKDALVLQSRNRAVFVERHFEALQSSHLEPKVGALAARMRPNRQGRLLIVDDRVPFASLGAGYPRAAHILETIASSGWFVTFYPLVYPDVCYEETYHSFPNSIEFSVGTGADGLVDFLSSRIGYYDVILVSRPHNMRVFLDAVRAESDRLKEIALIYDAEAIFAARDAMRCSLLGRPMDVEHEQHLVDAELALARFARTVLTVNEIDADRFRASGKRDVRVLGHAITPMPTEPSFEERWGLLFVGALDEDDSPNVDSLLWFVQDVMPILDQASKNTISLTVAGRCSAPSLATINHPRVRFLGRVHDLRPLYATARVFIAPTRYAAGVPMKIHEAAANGVPIVATTILAQQLLWSSGSHLLVADTARHFAEACHRLHGESGLWSTLRDGALVKIRDDCDPIRFKGALLETLSRINEGADEGNATTTSRQTSAKKKELCILHVGMHKTGTSSIQNALFRGLKDPRFHYSDLHEANHSIPVSSVFISDPKCLLPHRLLGRTPEQIESYNDQVLNRLLNSFSAIAPGVTEIISGEEIGFLNHEELIRVKSFLGKHFERIQIMIYVRPPHSYITSAFCEIIKHGKNRFSFDDCDPKYVRFETFEQVFSRENVLLKPYVPSRLFKRDVVEDFCQTFGIEFEFNLAPERSNRSLSLEALQLIYIFNKYGAVTPDHHQLRDHLISRVAPLGGSKLVLDPSLIAPLIEKNRDGLSYIQSHLGFALEEEDEFEDPVTIFSEADLLSFSVTTLAALESQFDHSISDQLPAVQGPEVVAKRVYDLMVQSSSTSTAGS
ncbi:MAG: rhamnan synthesis F family protein [Thiocapsa sp. C3-sup]